MRWLTRQSQPMFSWKRQVCRFQRVMRWYLKQPAATAAFSAARVFAQQITGCVRTPTDNERRERRGNPTPAPAAIPPDPVRFIPVELTQSRDGRGRLAHSSSSVITRDCFPGLTRPGQVPTGVIAGGAAVAIAIVTELPVACVGSAVYARTGSSVVERAPAFSATLLITGGPTFRTVFLRMRLWHEFRSDCDFTLRTHAALCEAPTDPARLAPG
jgi:hypothetical protein